MRAIDGYNAAVLPHLWLHTLLALRELVDVLQVPLELPMLGEWCAAGPQSRGGTALLKPYMALRPLPYGFII